MKHYKYSRKELIKKWRKDKTISFERDILATLSPEEESQKIMMEQVPKSSKEKECKHECLSKTDCYFKHKCTPTPSTNIKEIELLKVDELSYCSYKQWTKIMNKINEVTNSLNTIIKK